MCHEQPLIIVAAILADVGHDRVVDDPVRALTLLFEFLLVLHYLA